MKKYKFLTLAFTALMFGACSSDDVVVDDQPGVATPGEKGYVNLSINLPTQPSSRANDNFNNGDDKEYNVNNAYLFLFKGANEASATFQSGYVLSSASWNDHANESNITTNASLVQEITKPTIGNGEKLYALVVLNGDGVITKSGTTEAPTFKYGNYDFTVNSTKLSDLTSTNALSGLDISTVANLDNDGNFLMSNAPLFSKAGGATDPTGGTVSTLAEVNPNLIYTERAQAETGAAAANIYVERAVAKVTISANSGTATGNTNLTYTIAGWDLDVTNTKTFLVRNVAPQTSWWGYSSSKLSQADYRFVGSSAVASNLYRTYWGVDPNYSETYNADDFTIKSKQIYEEDGLNAVTTPLYCFENTFNVANMRQDRTTQVIIAADFDVSSSNADITKGDNFYTLRGDKTTFYTKENAVKAVKAAYLNNPDIKAAITDGKPTSDVGESDFDVTFDKTAGYLTISEIALNATGRGKFSTVPTLLENANNNAIVSAISEDLRVACYAGGRSYYHALIRHFDDSQTPWDASGVENSDSYGTTDSEKNYLGRYGVLRNNWYQINVTSIADLGDPEVPSVPGSYDDPTESWILVQINVLSWAVRSQSVGL